MIDIDDELEAMLAKTEWLRSNLINIDEDEGENVTEGDRANYRAREIGLHHVFALNNIAKAVYALAEAVNDHSAATRKVAEHTYDIANGIVIAAREHIAPALGNLAGAVTDAAQVVAESNE